MPQKLGIKLNPVSLCTSSTVHATKARDKLNSVSLCTSSTVDATKARDKLNPVSLCTSSTVDATKARDRVNPVSLKLLSFRTKVHTKFLSVAFVTTMYLGGVLCSRQEDLRGQRLPGPRLQLPGNERHCLTLTRHITVLNLPGPTTCIALATIDIDGAAIGSSGDQGRGVAAATFTFEHLLCPSHQRLHALLPRVPNHKTARVRSAGCERNIVML